MVGILLAEFGVALGGENLTLDLVGKRLCGKAGSVGLQDLDGIFLVHGVSIFFVIYIVCDTKGIQ